MDRGFTLWFTGLSGAGKSTLARLLETDLVARGRRVEVLDGDVVRTHLSKGLGFSREDRDINILRIGFVCELLSRNGVIAIAAAISPYRETRAQVRAQINDFVEVFVDCSLEECARRDVKGLYKEAQSGNIAGFTGVSDPYEAPYAPEIVVMTAEQTPEQSVAQIVAWLENNGLLAQPVRAAVGALNGHTPAGVAAGEAYTEEEEAAVSQRLEDLGYL
jgi:adenylyl-sulfate kinase